MSTVYFDGRGDWRGDKEQQGFDANIYRMEDDPLSASLSGAELSVCKGSQDCASGFVCINGLCVDRGGLQQTGDPACGNAVDSGGSSSSGGCIDSRCIQADPDCVSGITICRPDDEGVVGCECASNCSGDAECGAGRICVDGRCVQSECSESTEFTDCGQHFNCIDGRCFPDLFLCNDALPCPYGFSCVDGVCWPDPEDCSDGNDCEVSYDCEGGECLEPCEGESECSIGYSCKDGYCRPNVRPCDDGNCPEGYECVDGICFAPCDNGSCPAGYVCLDGHCWPEDYECPPGTSFGPNGCRGTCNTFCDSYFKTFGVHGPGCTELLECDVCNECSDQQLCVTIQENNPCWCIPPQDAPYCYDCAQDGSQDLNCEDCQYCAEIPEYTCSCGTTIDTVRICRSACDAGGLNITQEELEEKARRECALACGNNVDCYGFCDYYEYTISNNNFPACPANYICGPFQQSGIVPPRDLGGYCQAPIGPDNVSTANHPVSVSAVNVLTGQRETVPMQARRNGTTYIYGVGGIPDGTLGFISKPAWNQCTRTATEGAIFGLTVEGPRTFPFSYDYLASFQCDWASTINGPGGGRVPTIGKTAYMLKWGAQHTPEGYEENKQGPCFNRPAGSCDPRYAFSYACFVPVDTYDIDTLRLDNLSTCPEDQFVPFSFQPISTVQRVFRQECNVEGLPIQCLDASLNGDNVLSMSVIDEDDGFQASARNNAWATWRRTNPQRPFMLMVPGDKDRVTLPNGYDGFSYEVGRPQGGAPITDWWQLISQNIPPSVTTIDIWVDNSGSMTTATVQPDIQNFINNAILNGYIVRELDHPEFGENWISVHTEYGTSAFEVIADDLYCRDPGTRVQMCTSPPSTTSDNTTVLFDMTDVISAEIKIADCIGGVDYYQAEMRGTPFLTPDDGVVVCAPIGEETATLGTGIIATSPGFPLDGPPADKLLTEAYNGFYVRRDLTQYVVRFFYEGIELWSQNYTLNDWSLDEYTLPSSFLNGSPRAVAYSGLSEEVLNQRSTEHQKTLQKALPNNLLANLSIPDVINLDPTKSIKASVLAMPQKLSTGVRRGGNIITTNPDFDPYTVTRDELPIPSGEHAFDFWPQSMGAPQGKRSAIEGAYLSSATTPARAPGADYYGFTYVGNTYNHGAQGIYGFIYSAVRWDADVQDGVVPETNCSLPSDAGNVAWAGVCQSNPPRYPVD